MAIPVLLRRWTSSTSRFVNQLACERADDDGRDSIDQNGALELVNERGKRISHPN
jgi:hypothetical protein